VAVGARALGTEINRSGTPPSDGTANVIKGERWMETTVFETASAYFPVGLLLNCQRIPDHAGEVDSMKKLVSLFNGLAFDM